MSVVPVDVAIGRELVSLLSAGDLKLPIKAFEFTYDPYIDFEDMPTQTTLMVSPSTHSRLREARNRWSKGCTLYLTLIVEQEQNYNAAWFDNWLWSYDQVLDMVQDLRPLGNAVLEIEAEDRYDNELLHNNSRLVMSAEVTYDIIGE